MTGTQHFQKTFFPGDLTTLSNLKSALLTTTVEVLLAFFLSIDFKSCSFMIAVAKAATYCHVTHETLSVNKENI